MYVFTGVRANCYLILGSYNTLYDYNVKVICYMWPSIFDWVYSVKN